MHIKKIVTHPTEIKKLRVAAYCRVSTENDDQKESLNAQREHYGSNCMMTGNLQVYFMTLESAEQQQIPVTVYRHFYMNAE